MCIRDSLPIAIQCNTMQLYAGRSCVQGTPGREPPGMSAFGIRCSLGDGGTSDKMKGCLWGQRVRAPRSHSLYASFRSAMRVTSTPPVTRVKTCLLYTSDAADDLLCVDLGGR